MNTQHDRRCSRYGRDIVADGCRICAELSDSTPHDKRCPNYGSLLAPENECRHCVDLAASDPPITAADVAYVTDNFAQLLASRYGAATEAFGAIALLAREAEGATYDLAARGDVKLSDMQRLLRLLARVRDIADRRES